MQRLHVAILALPILGRAEATHPMAAPKSMARNAAWNIAGQTAPIAVALLAVPLLIGQLGIERFGFLSLAWVLIGYAGLFDFGLGRAITRVVALHLGAGNRDCAVLAGRTGTWVMLALGCLIGVVLFTTAQLLVDRLLKMPVALRDESLTSLRWLAFSMPIVLLTTALRGVLEAGQEFQRLNVIRMIMGVLSYLGPLLVSMFWPRLDAVVLAVILMRLLGAWLHLRACKQPFGPMLQFSKPDRVVLGGLFALGGWMSVSNIVGPLLTYLDRFVIAQSLSIEQVAYYATPYDLITRTLVLPFALMAVVFPAMASKAVQPSELGRLYSTSVRMLWVMMWPICFSALVLADEVLDLWLGSSFADAGAPVMQVLAVGVFFNVLAQAPANLIQASGSPKWMALLHLVELPLFVWLLWIVVQDYGIRGAALAWAARAAVDALMLYLLADAKLATLTMPPAWWLASAAFCGAWATAGVLVQDRVAVLAVWLVGLVAFGGFAWFFMLHHEDRAWIGKRLAARWRPAA